MTQIIRAGWVTSLVVVMMLVAGSAAGWLIARQWGAGNDEQPQTADSVQRAMDEEAAKPRFTGRIGDFVVVSPNDRALAEASDFSCGSTPVALSDALRREELWSDAFGDTGIGWACPGQGVRLINNEGPGGEGSDSGDGSSQARGYIRTVPLTVGRDAPRDRLELITVEGHPALLELPIPGYPYGQANLAVIERYPDGDKPGIAVFVQLAPSADAAIRHAEEIMP